MFSVSQQPIFLRQLGLTVHTPKGGGLASTHRGQYLGNVALYDFGKGCPLSQYKIGVTALLHLDFNLLRLALGIYFIDEGFGDTLICFTDSGLLVSIVSFAKCCHGFCSSVGQN